MSAFSPGPWRWEAAKCCGVEGGSLLRAHGIPLAWCADEGQHAEILETRDEDARLIAAAPELYEAVVDLLGWDGIDPRAAASARALIARIDGVVQDAPEALKTPTKT